jgi:MOSC domain-containing protein YiiM
MALACAACAARERKAWNANAGRESGDPPAFGEYFTVNGPNLDDI